MLHPGPRDAASKGCESLQVILCEAMLRSHAEFGTAQSANHRHDDYRITAAVGPLSFVASKKLFTDDLRQSQQGEQNVNVHGCFKMSFYVRCVCTTFYHHFGLSSAEMQIFSARICGGLDAWRLWRVSCPPYSTRLQRQVTVALSWLPRLCAW